MTDIVITDITTGIVDGTGIFDKLMASVKAHIHDEYDNGKIKAPEYSQVYLGAIQAVLAQSMQFALQEKQTEAQVDLLLAQTSELLLNGVADRELKAAQLVLAEKDIDLKTAELGIREKELEMKVYEFDEMMPLQKAKLASDVEVATAQIVGMGYDNQVKAEQVTMSVFEREFIQPKQLEKVTAEISLMGKDVELKDSQIIGSGYDNQVKEQQVAESEFRVNYLLPKELEKISADIIGSEYDNQVKEQQVLESTYKVEKLLPVQLLQLQKQVDVAERGMVEQELTGAKQREVLYVERVIKDKEAAALGMDKVVKVANTPATTEEVYTPKYEE